MAVSCRSSPDCIKLSLVSRQSFSSLLISSNPLDLLILLCFALKWDKMVGMNNLQGSLESLILPKNVPLILFKPQSKCTQGFHSSVRLWIGESSSTKPKTNTFLARMSISIGNNLRLSTSGKSVEGKRDRKRRRESFSPSRALGVNKAMGWEFKVGLWWKTDNW